jgi:DNA-binding CsgD family transcriptional regulator
MVHSGQRGRVYGGREVGSVTRRPAGYSRAVMALPTCADRTRVAPRSGTANSGNARGWFDVALAEGTTQPPEASVAGALALTLPAVKPADPLQLARCGLTNREMDVLRLLAEGQSDREIAGALLLSYRTVTSYVTNIFTKLQVDSRTAAATYAVLRGLV